MQVPIVLDIMDAEQLISEFAYRTSRSGGKGGQNVNKVETKVEARFDVAASAALTEEEKTWLLEKLAGKISAEGILSATNQTDRSQLTNKERATQKLLRIVEKALVKPKKRKRAPIPAGVKEARLEAKRRRSDVKAGRQPLKHGRNNSD